MIFSVHVVSLAALSENVSVMFYVTHAYSSVIVFILLFISCKPFTLVHRIWHCFTRDVYI